MYICVSYLTTTGSDNGLSPVWCQAIIRTNAGILLTGSSWTKFSEILLEIHTFSFTKGHFNISSVKWRPFRFSLNVLNKTKSNMQAEPNEHYKKHLRWYEPCIQKFCINMFPVHGLDTAGDQVPWNLYNDGILLFRSSVTNFHDILTLYELNFPEGT